MYKVSGYNLILLKEFEYYFDDFCDAIIAYVELINTCIVYVDEENGE